MRILPCLSIPFSLAAALMLAQPALAADKGAAPLSVAAKSADQSVKVRHVEAHDILILDVSPSMKPDEISSVFSGAAAYYLSDETMMDYKDGICRVNTVIYYAKEPVETVPHFLCNEASVNAFVDKYITHADLKAIRERAKKGTWLNRALKKAQEIFAQDDRISEDGYKLVSQRRRIVIVSDALGGNNVILRRQSNILSQDYRVTVSTISVANSDLAEQFREFVATPVLERERKGVFPIAPGITVNAYTGEEIGRAIQNILTLGGY